MAYEKYIEKDGKIYGPYVYHSKRVDGKVVSEYYGSKKTNYKKLLVVFSCFVFALLLFYAFTKLPVNFTGRAVLSAENSGKISSSENILKISLKEGELIPAASKIVFESEGESYEYPINEFILDKPIKGNYYIEGGNLSGSGLGYGFEGVKKIYPKISFVLGIYNEVESEVSSQTEETTKISETEINKTTVENISEDNSANISEEISINASESEQTETNQTEVESGVQSEEVISEEAPVPEATENSEGDLETEVAPEETSPETADVSEPASTEETSTETDGASEETPPGITGNIVRGIFGGVYNFFLRLSPTGRVTEEFGKEITGEVSATNEFVYELEEGQNAELIPGSVNVDGKKLPDNTTDVKIIGGNAVVMTDYSEEEEGFGEDYLTNNEKEFLINLSSINSEFSGKDFKVKLVNENEEILFLDNSIENIQKTEEKIIEKNISESVINVLTEDEIMVLTENFGDNFSVKTTKAEVFKGRIVVRHVLGEYWIEHSYDYKGDINEDLKEKIEGDKIGWLKEIARTLSGSDSKGQEINELIFDENYGSSISSQTPD